MATTTTYSGQLVASVSGNVSFSGDNSGTQSGNKAANVAYAASGGTAPTISGWLSGTLTVATPGDILLAHATDPFQGFGDALYPANFSPAGTKLKTLYIRNTGTTGSCIVARKTTAGLPIFETADDSVNLAPGDLMVIHKTAGTATLTTGSNDALTLTPTGSATLEILAVYGP